MLEVWMSHGDKVTELPPGFKLMASTPSCPIAGMADEARGFYAVQFHPEVTHTLQGKRDAGAASCATSAAAARLEHARLHRGGGRQASAPRWARGGHPRPVRRRRFVSVAAALIHRAIGDQLTCVFVDHGLLRLNEGEQVMEMFAGNWRQGHPCRRQRAVHGHLKGVTDPEPSARSSAASSSRCSRPRRAKLPNAKWLAQGTIYPDVIESAGAKTKKAHTIKSHHNVGGLPETAGPEAAGAAARTVQGRGARTGRGAGPAARHGLPPSLPRPGPGRAHPGRGEAEYADLLRRADAIFIDELRACRARAGTT
jgi:GMP synthase (glutamine-hydrolysing)